MSSVHPSVHVCISACPHLVTSVHVCMLAWTPQCPCFYACLSTPVSLFQDIHPGSWIDCSFIRSVVDLFRKLVSELQKLRQIIGSYSVQKSTIVMVGCVFCMNHSCSWSCSHLLGALMAACSIWYSFTRQEWMPSTQLSFLRIEIHHCMNF